MKLYAELKHIDYEKLFSGIYESYQTTKITHKKQNFFSSVVSGISNGLKELFRTVVINSWSLKKIIENPSLLKLQAVNQSKKYGASFTVLKIGDDTLINERTGGKNMLNISASIDIDYDKLSKRISESKNKKDSNLNKRVYETVRIVKPFISKTMSTIPPSAIAELFDLLAKEKIIKLAGSAGVTISSISVKPG